MMINPVYMIFAAPAIFGFASHIFWSRGEWDGIIWKVLFILTLLHNGLVVGAAWLGNGYIDSSFVLFEIELSYCLGLFSAIAIYRAWFHPLKRFPGPFWARIWVWWRVYATIRSGHRHAIVLYDLHSRYGDIVRIGPNLLSINTAESVSVIHGSRSQFIKGPAYENPMKACINWDRNPTSHRQRRIKWEVALGPKASVDYAPRIIRLADLLVQRLSQTKGTPTSVNKWCHFFAFDVMGDLGFGRSYRQLETCETHPTIDLIMKFMMLGVYATMVPWLHCILSRLPAPFIEMPNWAFHAFAKRSLEERWTRKVDLPDIMSHVLSSNQKRPLTFDELVSDALIMQVGGSDTTTSALLHILYRLAMHSDVQQKLFNEIAEALPPQQALSWNAVSNLPYLNAVIQETMRLHPPAASGLPRVVPAGGVEINGTHIPAGVTVLTPTYTLQRDERYFAEAQSFIPERWTTQPHMVKDPSAHIPFAVGAYNCAGKFLALLEMKLTVADIVRNLEVRLPGGADPMEVERRVEGGWRDCLTTQAAPLELCFVQR